MAELFPQQRRSKGKHVSHAIKDIMQSLYPDRFEERPIDIVRANLGNALERSIIAGLVESDPGRYMRPGELEFDGWYGTPDLWDLGPEHRKHHKGWSTREVKLTWASARRAIEDGPEAEWFWRYWVQLKAYCHMAGQRHGSLTICFVNGDYTRGPGGAPQVFTWADKWSVDELHENWEMLKARC